LGWWHFPPASSWLPKIWQILIFFLTKREFFLVTASLSLWFLLGEFMMLKALTILALVLAVLLTNKLALVIAVALEIIDGMVYSWRKSSASRL
jgi:hypothetical protein